MYVHKIRKFSTSSIVYFWWNRLCVYIHTTFVESSLWLCWTRTWSRPLPFTGPKTMRTTRILLHFHVFVLKTRYVWPMGVCLLMSHFTTFFLFNEEKTSLQDGIEKPIAVYIMWLVYLSALRGVVASKDGDIFIAPDYHHFFVAVVFGALFGKCNCPARTRIKEREKKKKRNCHRKPFPECVFSKRLYLYVLYTAAHYKYGFYKERGGGGKKREEMVDIDNRFGHYAGSHI